MKPLIFFLISILFCRDIAAQIHQGPSKKLDSVSKKVILFLKDKQPDSVYALTGKAFREKITAENFNAITTTQIFPATDFKNVKYVSTRQGINKYRIEGTPALQLLIGLDADDKIQTLLIQEFTED